MPSRCPPPGTDAASRDVGWRASGGEGLRAPADSRSTQRRPVAAAAGRLDPEHVARDQVTRHLRGELRVVEEVAPSGSRSTAALALGRVPPPLADDRGAARLENADLADDAVAAAARPLSARPEPEPVALDAQRIRELESLHGRVERVRHGHVDGGGAVRAGTGALAAADRLVVGEALVA